jgi:glutamine synthetase
VPQSGPETRRLENRIIGMDCNPYIAIATSLACGLLGIRNRVQPRPQATEEVWVTDHDLPTSLSIALDMFRDNTEVYELLGPAFCKLFHDIKRAENKEYQREISPWEREHLLLNV